MASSATGSYETPHAIPILECVDHKFKINQENLIKIFRRPEIQDMPISIVSIAGAFRGGKSFMSNFFLRYLRNDGYKNENWMGNLNEPMTGGFEWRGGTKACTNGIQIWSEIFYIDQGGRKVAIMLMDTQGLFDNRTESKTNSIIFALSTLISSVQIFNLSKQISESDLEFLQLFTNYAEAASNSGEDEKPFQKLIFLIRDWQNEQEFYYGREGGNEYLQKTLHEKSSSKELLTVRKYLTSSFSDIECAFLPYPGKAVIGKSKPKSAGGKIVHGISTAVGKLQEKSTKKEKKNYDGRLIDLDEDFLEHTAAFVERLFKPENIVKKIINGKEVNAMTILQYISDYSETFSNGKLPDPKSMAETLAEAQNLEAQKTCSERYHQEMKLNFEIEYVEEALLHEVHKMARSNCLNLFETETKFGSEENREKHRDYLKAQITREYDALCQCNKLYKNYAVARIHAAVDEIKREYEKVMDEVTKDTKFIEDEKLEAAHDDCVAKARRGWSNVKVSSALKDEPFKVWNGFIERKIQRLREDNAEKKRIAEAQKQEREAALLRLDHESQHREDLLKVTEKYMKESILKQKDQDLRSTNRQKLENGLLELGIKRESTLFWRAVQKFEGSLEKYFAEAERKNKEHQNEAEARIREVVDHIKAEYEKAMDEVTKNMKFIEVEKLEAAHNDCVAKARRTWSNVKESSALKSESCNEWNGFIERKIKRLRGDNAEKKRIAESQKQELEAVTLRLNTESQHREDLRKVIEKYLEETNLKQKDQDLRSTNREILESGLLELGIKRESSLFKEEVQKLNDSFEKNFVETERKNKENENEAEARIRKVVDDIKYKYEKTMAEVTKDAKFIEDEKLEAAHDECVAKAKLVWSNVKESSSLKDELFKVWNAFIDRTIRRLREDNAEKKKIAKAQKQELEAATLRLDIESQHRKDLRKVTENYLKESSLKEKDQDLRLRNRENLESGLLELGISRKSSLFRKEVQKLNESFEKEFNEAERKNKENENEAETRIRKAVEDIKGEYEKAMDEVTKGIQFIDDDTLEAAHADCVFKAQKAWKNVNEPGTLKNGYIAICNSFIERKIKRMRQDNVEKKRLAEAQNQQRDAELLYADIKSQHKQDLKGITRSYLRESNLKQKDQRLRTKNHEKLIRGMLHLGIKRESSLIGDYVEKLNDTFEKDYDEIKKENIETKKKLLNSLEQQRNKAYVAYDNAMKEVLGKAYVKEESKLKAMHKDVVNKLMEDMRSREGENEDEDSMIADHVKIAEKDFSEKKYEETKTWNEKNKGFFRKCFEYCRDFFSVVGAIISAAIAVIKMIR